MHLKSACGIGLKPSQEKASLVKGLKATLSLDDLGGNREPQTNSGEGGHDHIRGAVLF